MVNFKFELIAAKQTFRFYVLKNCANEKKNCQNIDISQSKC